ncbi:MAG: hypothetical protein Q9227_003765 [Pyrenula ochraceoflavens]
MAPTRRSKSQSISSIPADTADSLKAPNIKPSGSKRSSKSPPLFSESVDAQHVLQKQRSSSYKLPNAVRFPLAVLISYSLSVFLFSIPDLAIGDLAAVSKGEASWPETLGLLAWKTLELAICWVGGFDVYDAASLITLTHAPYYTLLWLFYLIRPTSNMLALAITVISFSVPFALLRPTALIHYPSSAPRNSVYNRAILADPQTWIYTSILATAMFALVLEGSFATYLSGWLTTRFNGLPILRAEYAPGSYSFMGVANWPALLVGLLPVGLATREFLFVPSISTPPSEVYSPRFDTSTAGFREHFYQNIWGWWTTREQALIVRVGVATVLILANTTLEVWANIQGASPYGAFGYAIPWALGVMVVGIAFGVVGESA